MKPFRQEKLPNGLQIKFFDETNRYFGDYHRVCLRVVMTFDLEVPGTADLSDAPFWNEVRSSFGQTLDVTKRLERMGVPGAAVKQTVSDLIDDFLKAADEYMSRPDYPRRLAQGELVRLNKNLRFY
ncbi:MAG: hypothetical protein KAT93_00315 [Desulfuromonadales bacterium]|nr:hypothetical protein [Desulfuromonadales bacterium]